MSLGNRKEFVKSTFMWLLQLHFCPTVDMTVIFSWPDPFIRETSNGLVGNKDCFTFHTIDSNVKVSYFIIIQLNILWWVLCGIL